MEKKRLFVAVDLPQPVIDQIIKIQQQLANRHLFQGRLTHPEHLHLTLKFIGEVDDQTHERVKKALETFTFPKIKSSLGQLGSFAAGKETSIIWIALTGEELGLLAHAINDVLNSIVPHDKRDFVSHVTIARVKSVPDEELLSRYLAEAPVPAVPFEATEFVLKDSVLSEKGPYYTVLERYPLV